MDRGWKKSLLAALVAFQPMASTAQEPAGEGTVSAPPARADRFRLAVPFPPEMILAGDDAVCLRTVDAGSSLEIPVVALRAEGRLTPHVLARAVVHVIDLYSRNPTSSDDELTLREAWVLFGSKSEALEETGGAARARGPAGREADLPRPGGGPPAGRRAPGHQAPEQAGPPVVPTGSSPCRS